MDLRDKEIFTIDGEDAKDLDDAVCVDKNEDGTYTLGVHIADVSYYVQDGSLLNKEAIKEVQVCICLVALFQCFQLNCQMDVVA